MTDKQIIIDGVDVSGCEWIREVGLDSEYICTCNSPNKTSGYCKDNHNCYYKQLKRAEQECERLKREIDIRSCANIELSLEFKKYKKAIDEIEEIADNNYEIPEMEQIFLIIGGLDV